MDKPHSKEHRPAKKPAATALQPDDARSPSTPLPKSRIPLAHALPVLLDLGEAMMITGADVHTVELLIQRLGMAYGAYKMNVLVITTSIVVTATLPDGTEITQTRRIEDPTDNDFAKLERYTRLCHRCIESPIDPSVLQERLRGVKSMPISKVKLFLSGLLATSSFAIFFGGSWIDATVSAAFSVLICLMMIYLRPLTPNTIIFDFLASLVSGIGMCIAARIIPDLSLGMVMIGDIMILIPGVAMTSAIRDMISGDTVSGSLRLVESCLWASALALGFMCAMWLFGLDGQDINSNAAPPVQLIAAIFGSVGFALFFNVRNGLLALCTLGGFLTEGIYLLAMNAGFTWSENAFITAAIAAVFAAVYSEFLSRKLHVPITVFFIISVIPLVPGRGLYFTMQTAVQQNWASCGEFAMATFQIALGIAIGIVIVWAFVQTVRNIRRIRLRTANLRQQAPK